MIPEPVQKLMAQEPYQFDFAQLIRLLYLYQNGEVELHDKLVGYENAPENEIVRFKSATGLRHSSSDICKIEDIGDGRYSVTVSFLGLVGASGVMPHHYSQMVLDRIKANDLAMRNFFDLFHHRIISNFFRASVKYRLPFQHELFSRFKPTQNGSVAKRTIEKDAITRSISCTVGLGEISLQNRMGIDDRNLLFYSGNFSNSRPTLSGLTRMLQEFTQMNVEIRQFQFEWLYLESGDQTNLSNPRKRLGQNVVIGNRVGSIQNRFRIRLGPVHWQQFLELLPSRKRLQEFTQFTRAYIGLGLDFDFQLVLKGSEVPCMQLGNEECGLLGWNTWMVSSTIDRDIEDAVFDVESIDAEFSSA